MIFKISLDPGRISDPAFRIVYEANQHLTVGVTLIARSVYDELFTEIFRLHRRPGLLHFDDDLFGLQ